MNTTQYRVEVWKDTIEKCTNGIFKDLPFGHSRLFYANDKNFVKVKIESKYEKTNINILNDDVLTAAEMLYKLGETNILVLNLASWQNVGGGVDRGAAAQEEELFRRSNYFLSFDNRYHPLKKAESVYTPIVTVIKDPHYLNLTNPFKVSMLAMPAIKCPHLTADNKFNKRDYQSMCVIIENIFKVAILENHGTLVLGSLGCGCYMCPPDEVVKIFNIYLKKYNKCFKNIVFAILSKSDDNFKIFNQHIVKL